MEKEATVHHRVVFIADSSSCRIEPPHSVVAREDEVLFSAIGSDAVEVYFPRPGLFTSGDTHLTLKRSDVPHREVISPDAPIGSYPFAAYCTTQNRFAKGGSDGEIIIQT
jgi:hypothetical protein